MVEHRVQLIRYQFVWREESKRLGIIDHGLINQFPNCLHTALLGAFLHTILLPIRNVKRLVILICLYSLSKLLVIISGNDALD